MYDWNVENAFRISHRISNVNWSLWFKYVNEISCPGYVKDTSTGIKFFRGVENVEHQFAVFHAFELIAVWCDTSCLFISPLLPFCRIFSSLSLFVILYQLIKKKEKKATKSLAVSIFLSFTDFYSIPCHGVNRTSLLLCNSISFMHLMAVKKSGEVKAGSVSTPEHILEDIK